MSQSAPLTFVLKGYFSLNTNGLLTKLRETLRRRARHRLVCLRVCACVCVRTCTPVHLQPLTLVFRADSFLTQCSFTPLLEDFRLALSLCLPLSPPLFLGSHGPASRHQQPAFLPHCHGDRRDVSAALPRFVRP